MPTVKFRYSAASNISFKGVIDSHIEQEDWDEMTNQDQEMAESEVLHRLVDLVKIEESI